jgi:hypothetical protein
MYCLLSGTNDKGAAAERVLVKRGPDDIRTRLSAYLDIIEREPWTHELWVRASHAHPDIERLVAHGRRRLFARGGRT